MKAVMRRRDRRGFTLAETLLAVMILLMVSSIVATGIPVAKNVYEKVVLSANSETTLSTAVMALRNELGTARDISKINVNGQQGLLYFRSETGYYSIIYNDPDEGIILKKGVTDQGAEIENVTIQPERLIRENTATKYQVRFGSIDYEKPDSQVIVKNLQVVKNGSVLAEIDFPLRFRVIAGSGKGS